MMQESQLHQMPNDPNMGMHETNTCKCALVKSHRYCIHCIVEQDWTAKQSHCVVKQDWRAEQSHWASRPFGGEFTVPSKANLQRV